MKTMFTKTKKIEFILFGIALVFGILFIGCNQGNGKSGSSIIGKVWQVKKLVDLGNELDISTQKLFICLADTKCIAATSLVGGNLSKVGESTYTLTGSTIKFTNNIAIHILFSEGTVSVSGNTLKLSGQTVPGVAGTYILEKVASPTFDEMKALL